MEIPPPPYYMVVRENLYTPTPSVNYNGAGFHLPETSAAKHSEAVGRTPGNTLYFTSWLVGSSVSPTLVRPGNGSPVIISATGSPVLLRSAGNPDVIRSLDSPDVIRSMGGHFSARPLVTPCLIKSPSNPSLNISTAGPSLFKSPSTPALGKLFSGVSLASSGGDSSFSKSSSTSAFDKLYISSSLTASTSDFSFSKSPSSPALKLLDKASESSSQCICKGVPNPLYLRKSPSTPALGKLVIKPAGSPSVKTSSCSPSVDNLPNSSPGSPSGRSRNVVVFAPYGRPFFGNLTRSAVNTLPGSRSVRPPSTSLPDSPCIIEPVESPIVNKTPSNFSLNNLPGSPVDSRSYESFSVSRSHEPLSVKCLDSPSINALPSSSCTVNSDSPTVIRSLSNPLVRHTGVASVRKELQERDHYCGGMEREGRAGQYNTEVVLNVAALTLPQDQTCHTDGTLVESHVF
ncbi:mucin-2-like isoform X2 [Cherax quadricarinatus]